MEMEGKKAEAPGRASMAAVFALAAALLLGTCLCLRRAASATEAVPMILLGVASCFFTLKRCHQEESHPRLRRILPWLTAALGILLLALSNLVDGQFRLLWLGGLFFLAWAVVFWNLTPKAAARCWFPLAISLLVLPFHETLMLSCSQPFRLASAIMAEFCLRLFNCPIVRDGTSLMVGDHAIVITYACSGIDQLFVLSLVGYVIVQTVHRRTLHKVLHFLLILPIIIYVNTLRLVVTIVLFNILGERVLQGAWHDGLGYAMVVLCAAIFWYAPQLVILLTPKEKDSKEK